MFTKHGEHIRFDHNDDLIEVEKNVVDYYRDHFNFTRDRDKNKQARRPKLCPRRLGLHLQRRFVSAKLTALRQVRSNSEYSTENIDQPYKT